MIDRRSAEDICRVFKLSHFDATMNRGISQGFTFFLSALSAYAADAVSLIASAAALFEIQLKIEIIKYKL